MACLSLPVARNTHLFPSSNSAFFVRVFHSHSQSLFPQWPALPFRPPPVIHCHAMLPLSQECPPVPPFPFAVSFVSGLPIGTPGPCFLNDLPPPATFRCSSPVPRCGHPSPVARNARPPSTHPPTPGARTLLHFQGGEAWFACSC